MYLKKLFFCIYFLASTIIMNQESNSGQKALSNKVYQSLSSIQLPNLKLIQPKDLIDPKTGKAYKNSSDAWEEFWRRAYQRDEILENLRKQAYLNQAKK